MCISHFYAFFFFYDRQFFYFVLDYRNYVRQKVSKQNLVRQFERSLALFFLWDWIKTDSFPVSVATLSFQICRHGVQHWLLSIFLDLKLARNSIVFHYLVREWWAFLHICRIWLSEWHSLHLSRRLAVVFCSLPLHLLLFIHFVLVGFAFCMNFSVSSLCLDSPVSHTPAL